MACLLRGVKETSVNGSTANLIVLLIDFVNRRFVRLLVKVPGCRVRVVGKLGSISSSRYLFAACRHPAHAYHELTAFGDWSIFLVEVRVIGKHGWCIQKKVSQYRFWRHVRRTFFLNVSQQITLSYEVMGQDG